MKQLLILVAGTALMMPTTAFAAPSMKAVEQASQEFDAWLKTTPREQAAQEMDVQITERLSQFDMNELTVEQIDLLAEMILRSESSMEAAMPRLEELAKSQDASGAGALMLETVFTMIRTRQVPSPDAIGKVLSHPEAPSILSLRSSGPMMMALGYTDADTLTKNRDHLVRLAKGFKSPIPPMAAGNAGTYYEALTKTGLSETKEGRAQLDEIRGHVVAAMEDALKRVGPDSPQTKDEIEAGMRAIALQGGEAPNIDFNWTSEGDWHSQLTDLRGQVVVVDFWATWCGPCIRSFPKVQKLQEHYKDSPVTIIGVTSLQGTHFGKDGRVDTKGNPELEYELMEDFIAEHEINWPIAFSEQNVFNPDYGVRGIPHVVIIDPEGKIRHRGLNPLVLGEGEEEAMINAILEEFNLPVPSES